MTVSPSLGCNLIDRPRRIVRDHFRRRRWGLVALLMLVLLAGGAVSQTVRAQADRSGADRPNILWLIAEDMGPELGAYGQANVRTPHLDSLATQGMLFTHAFTTSPVCSPSRSALNTGMYQFTIGAHEHRSHRPDDPSPYPHPLPEGVEIVSDWLRHAGYVTGNITDFPEGVSFDGTGKTDWNFSYEGRPFDTAEWTELTHHRPFYGQVNFALTHRGDQWNRADELIANPAAPDEVDVPPYYPDHPVVRENWAQYLNSVMALDQRVGQVLGQLRRSGVADSTIVVFLADHGRAMPRGKQWPYDSGLQVPLIVYVPPGLDGPAGYEAGTRSDRLVSGIDIPATTLAMAGVPDPPTMQGEVFLGPDRDAPRSFVFGGRDRGDETVDRVRTIRSRRYRYIRNYNPGRPFFQTNRYKLANYPTIWVMHDLHRRGELTPTQRFYMQPERPEEELYNVIADPHETVNLTDSMTHRSLLHQMRTRLDRWIQRIDDRGRVPEDPEVQWYYEVRMKELYSDRIAHLCEEWDMSGEEMEVCRK